MGNGTIKMATRNGRTMSNGKTVTLCVTYYHLLSHFPLMPFLVSKVNFVFSIFYFPHLKCMAFSSLSCARIKLGIIDKTLDI